MKIFQEDSVFTQTMTRGFDMILLNILFIICCLPVVTIGASCVALHTVSLKYAQGLEPYVIKEFFIAFRKEFRQSTIVWLLMLVIGAFLYVDTAIALNGGAGGKAMQMLLFCLDICCLFVGIYIFPLMARYQNKIGRHLKNAALLAIREFKKTLLLAAIIIIWLLIGMYAPPAFMLAWLILNPLIAFSARAVFQDRILLKVFENNDSNTDEI